MSSNLFRVLSFNIRYAAEDDPLGWPERCPLVIETIQTAQPDVIGVQEPLFPQIKDLGRNLPEYDWIGWGRQGGSQGEHTPVFFRRDRFEAVAYSQWWLSEQPRLMGSQSWAMRFPRTLVQVTLRDEKSEREIDFWNTHFDHDSPRSRVESAKLVRQWIQERKTLRPLVLTGDFNTDPGSEPHAMLTEPIQLKSGERVAMVDAQTSANEEPAGTFHAWGEVEPPRRIDWILHSVEWTCQSTKVFSEKIKGHWPSDHHALLAVLELKD